MAAWNTEKAMSQVEEMIGKQYGKLTVVKYAGRGRPEGDGKGDIYVECVCECGETRKVEAWKIRRGYITECKSCAYRGRKCGVRKHKPRTRNVPETLCWRCAKATNRHKCPWAGLVPRDDWEAIPVHREERIPTSQGKYIVHTIDTYSILSCPGFEEG